jgi:hypothetical protein
MYLYIHPNGVNTFDWITALPVSVNAGSGRLSRNQFEAGQRQARYRQKTNCWRYRPRHNQNIEKAGATENIFKAVAEEFLEANSIRWSASHKRHR